MNVKPKYISYNIRRMCKVSLIEYVHENDVETMYLEVNLTDDGEPIELLGSYDYSASMINKATKALIKDDVVCSLNESGNVVIKIDDFHTLGAQDILIELTVSNQNRSKVLVPPFPLWIHVNASILDDAQVTPESQGTVPELLEDAEKALEDAQQAIEDAGDYDNLDNKPSINGHELSGDQSGSDLGLQNQLTAGDNVTIDENGVISAEGGGSEIVSGVVNQNGTITFTDSGGNIFTTTGESVIGPQGIQGATGPQGIQGEKGDKGADGFSPTATVTQTQSGATVTITDKNGTTTANISNGAPGQDYVLTDQDKTDIANIVLSELPTTQGVQYGNTSN